MWPGRGCASAAAAVVTAIGEQMDCLMTQYVTSTSLRRVQVEEGEKKEEQVVKVI